MTDEKSLKKLIDYIDSIHQRDDKLVAGVAEVKNETIALSGKIDAMRVCINSVKKDVQEHEVFINGPPKPGAKLEIDRLSQTSKFQRRGFWIIAGAVTVGIIKAGIEFFQK